MNGIRTDDLSDEQSSTYQAVIGRRSSAEDVARILWSERRYEQSSTHTVVIGRPSSVGDITRILWSERRYEQSSTHTVMIKHSSAEDVARILEDEPQVEQSLTHPAVIRRRSSAEDVARILGDEPQVEQSSTYPAMFRRRSSADDVARILEDEPWEEQSSLYPVVIGRRSSADEVAGILIDQPTAGRGASIHGAPLIQTSTIYANEHSTEGEYSNLAPMPPFMGNYLPMSKIEHPVTYSSYAQVDWPPAGVQDHYNIGYQPSMCSIPHIPNSTVSEGMPWVGQDTSNFVREPVGTMQTGGLEPAVALSSHGQNWSSVGVPNHYENEHFPSIHSYDIKSRQPPIAISSTDQIQPSVYKSSFDREQFSSGGGTLTIHPTTSKDITDIFHESSTLCAEPPAVLHPGSNDNPPSASETVSYKKSSPSCTTPTPVSNHATWQKPLLEGNTQENTKEHVTQIGVQIKRFTCHVCGLKFKWQSVLDIHSRIHTGETPHKCAECPAVFTSKNNLNVHLKIHRGVKQFQCTDCPARFTQKSNLKTHFTTHTGYNPHNKCNICGRTFSSKQSMKNHIRLMHDDE